MKHNRNASPAVYKLLGGTEVERQLLHYTEIPCNTRKGRTGSRTLVPSVPFYEVISRSFEREEAALLKHR
eukprot:7481828-Pyramimonas_sp.AAC.1